MRWDLWELWLVWLVTPFFYNNKNFDILYLFITFSYVIRLWYIQRGYLQQARKNFITPSLCRKGEKQIGTLLLLLSLCMVTYRRFHSILLTLNTGIALLLFVLNFLGPLGEFGLKDTKTWRIKMYTLSSGMTLVSIVWMVILLQLESQTTYVQKGNYPPSLFSYLFSYLSSYWSKRVKAMKIK